MKLFSNLLSMIFNQFSTRNFVWGKTPKLKVVMFFFQCFFNTIPLYSSILFCTSALTHILTVLTLVLYRTPFSIGVKSNTASKKDFLSIYLNLVSKSCVDITLFLIKPFAILLIIILSVVQSKTVSERFFVFRSTIVPGGTRNI